MSSRPTRIGAYIDGFNLYYGALRGTPHKWLNLAELVSRHMPMSHRIATIKYCTARVRPRPHDPQQHVRQDIYFRALRTIPNLEIVLGHFLEVDGRYPVRPQPNPSPPRPVMVDVTRTEEKGSDVNVAAWMLLDGFKDVYDVAVIVTNDSDLAEPVRMVTQELGLDVFVLKPGRRRPSSHLQRHATRVFAIDPAIVAASQFPPVMTDAVGTFRKPATW